jgi:3-isopropylmalate/(R)-2-methylmalate dehydratase small subunit
MSILLSGRARRLGDDVNTDYIISSARKKETIDEHMLKQYLLETVDPGFASSVKPGDVLVAGRNFGCGSAMEVAATVILAAGVRAVIAESFSRTFYRNAVNNGLLPVECDTSGIGEADAISVEASAARAVVWNATTGTSLPATTPSGIAADILSAGGLVPYLRTTGRFVPPR